MRITISAKLKLRHSPEQKAMLDAVSLAYRDALNYASEEAFKLDKTSSAPKLHAVPISGMGGVARRSPDSGPARPSSKR